MTKEMLDQKAVWDEEKEREEVEHQGPPVAKNCMGCGQEYPLTYEGRCTKCSGFAMEEVWNAAIADR